MANQQESNKLAADKVAAQADLQAAKLSDAQEAAAAQAEANKATLFAAEAKAKGEKPPYRVTPGQSVSTIRGIVDGGDGTPQKPPEGIWPHDFHDKQAAVDDLLNRGALTRS